MTAVRARQPRPPWPRAALAMAALVVALLGAGLYFGAQSGPATAGSAIGGAALGLMFLTMAGVGLVVARFQRRNPIGYLLLGAALCFLITLDGGGYATLAYPQHRDLPLGAVALVLGQSGMLAVVMLPLIGLLFPDGRLPSRRWRRLVVIALALAGTALAANEIAIVAGLLGHRLRVSSDGTPVIGSSLSSGITLATAVATAALLASAVVRQVLAWRHAGSARRQQIKWLLSGVGVFIVIGVPSLGISADIWEVGISVGFAALPLAIGVGILRYRLYEIDRVISRTVSYALVTGLVAGVYIGVVLLTTDVLRFASSVAVAASTLVAAVLFNPLRRRAQRLVDKRFNRARYDAEAIVAGFADRMRAPADLPGVQAELVATVNRAFEPAHASVWVRVS